MLLQQGDVIIQSVDSIPNNVTEVKSTEHGKYYLSSNSHSIGSITEQIKMFKEDSGTLYILNEVDVTLHHKEHDDFVIPPGTWRSYKVKEYDHFLEEVREVED